MPPPCFSAILVTCNRRRTLQFCLECLAAQRFDPRDLEVIVVDDGSTDGTCEWLPDNRWPFALRCLHTGNPAGVFGVMRGRNIGLLHARGELALFVDDDMALDDSALAAICAAHRFWAARGEEVVVRGWFGQRRTKGPLHLWLRGLSFSRYRPQRELARNPTFRDMHEHRNDLAPGQAPIGMLSVPRFAALEVDGFPEQAAAWGMDYEFQARLKTILGLRFVFEPRAYALHGPLPGDMTNRAYRRRLDAWPDAPRRGLSAHAGVDPARYVLGAGRLPAGANSGI